MVKKSIELSGSFAVSPWRLTVLFGGSVLLVFAGIGGWLDGGDDTRETVAPGLLPPRLSLLL